MTVRYPGGYEASFDFDDLSGVSRWGKFFFHGGRSVWFWLPPPPRIAALHKAVIPDGAAPEEAARDNWRLSTRLFFWTTIGTVAAWLCAVHYLPEDDSRPVWLFPLLVLLVGGALAFSVSPAVVPCLRWVTAYLRKKERQTRARKRERESAMLPNWKPVEAG